MPDSLREITPAIQVILFSVAKLPAELGTLADCCLSEFENGKYRKSTVLLSDKRKQTFGPELLAPQSAIVV